MTKALAPADSPPVLPRSTPTRLVTRLFFLGYPLLILLPTVYVMVFDPTIPESWGPWLFVGGILAASTALAEFSNIRRDQLTYDGQLAQLLLWLALIMLYLQFFRLGIKWATRLTEVQPLEPVFLAVLVAIGVAFASYLGLWRFWLFGLEKLSEPIEFVVIKCVATLVALTEVFTALNASFIHYGWSVAEPAVDRHATFPAVEEFYYWHFFDQLPQLDIPKAFHWESNLALTDPLSGGLLVLYRILVIIPVAAVLLEVYRRFRQPDRQVLERLDRIEASIRNPSPHETTSVAESGPGEPKLAG